MSQKSGPGWVRGTGRRDCPVGYPVKGNEPSNVYYEPGDPGYPQVIPEMCFEDAATADRVGFTHVGGGSGAKAAAAAPAAGFLRQTGGGRACPDGYPIKGNEPSNIFYRPEDPGYAQVIPEVCFQDVSEAEKAGFSRIKVEATKRTEPVAPVRKEEVAGAAVAGAAAAGAASAAKGADVAKAAEPVKAAEPARVAAPPPPPPPPPPPAPVAEASGGGWMKWLLPLLALAALAAGIWYFTRDDKKDEPTPTVAATVAAGVATIQADKTEVVGAVTGSVEAAQTQAPGVVGSVEAAATENPGAVGSVEANVAAAQGSVAAGVANVEGSVVAAATENPGAVASVEAAATGVAGTVESGVAAAQGSIAAGVAGASGTVQALATSAAGTVEAVTGGSPVASPAASPSAAGALEIDAKDIAFVPTELTINAADEPVTITMKNTGAALHNFSIDALDIDIDVNPGESAEIVIPAGTAPGTYDFYCNVPGHKEAGMVGKLTVS